MEKSSNLEATIYWILIGVTVGSEKYKNLENFSYHSTIIS
jgi:hypothetical protein